MKLALPIRFLLALPLAAACFIPVGCAAHVFAPPPSYAWPSPLVQEADRLGFRSGSEDGARDAAYGNGYHPRRDRKYADTPGYDPGLGPFPVYRDYFRTAYLRGYDSGFYHRG
jgi:hypothetical protein